MFGVFNRYTYFWIAILVVFIGITGRLTDRKKKNINWKKCFPKKISMSIYFRHGWWTYSTRCGAGIEVTHNMRALQTPLHEVTLGSGYRLKTHTWPTYPSLLHTHTSLWFNAGAAHVNCSPALVFRIGTGPTKSAFGLRSVDKTIQNKIINRKKFHSIYDRDVCSLRWTQ